MSGRFVRPEEVAMPIIRVTDDTTAAEIHEAIAHLSSLPTCETRERRIDALLDELLERRADTVGLSH